MAKYSVLKITKEGSNGWQSSSAYSDLDDLMDNSHFEKSPFKVELDNVKNLWNHPTVPLVIFRDGDEEKFIYFKKGYGVTNL